MALPRGGFAVAFTWTQLDAPGFSMVECRPDNVEEVGA